MRWRRQLVVKEYAHSFGRLASAVDIVILSDLHFASGDHEWSRYTAILEEVRSRRPDLIFFLGDLLSSRGWGALPELADLLQDGLPACPRFAVPGNHDHELRHGVLSDFLSATGFRLLVNEIERLPLAQGDIALCGLDDDRTGAKDPAILEAMARTGLPVLCLAHDPASFADIPENEGILMLSGHTHGGQIRLPFLPILYNASRAPLRWSHGHVQERGNTLIVSAGLGVSGPVPYRLGVPPEVVHLRID